MPSLFSDRLKALPLGSLDSTAAQAFWSQIAQPERFAPIAPLLEGIAAGSPFLKNLMLVHVDFIARLREEEPEEILKSLVAEFHATVRLTEVEPVRRSLRLTKAKASLLVALCDLGGVWDVEAVIGSMTLIADAALQAALNFLLLANNRKAKLLLQDESDPSIGCGYVVIAMGKHGANELNFRVISTLLSFTTLMRRRSLLELNPPYSS